jgi:hypothetical protein
MLDLEKKFEDLMTNELIINEISQVDEVMQLIFTKLEEM